MKRPGILAIIRRIGFAVYAVNLTAQLSFYSVLSLLKITCHALYKYDYLPAQQQQATSPPHCKTEIILQEQHTYTAPGTKVSWKQKWLDSHTPNFSGQSG